MHELFIDLFVGGGRTSSGIEDAIGRSVYIAVNHDPDSILMHCADHPGTRHYCEDVWTVDPQEACGNNPVAMIWFSPDCTHFSMAKGAIPVIKKIRGLARVGVKWAYKARRPACCGICTRRDRPSGSALYDTGFGAQGRNIRRLYQSALDRN